MYTVTYIRNDKPVAIREIPLIGLAVERIVGKQLTYEELGTLKVTDNNPKGDVTALVFQLLAAYVVTEE